MEKTKGKSRFLIISIILIIALLIFLSSFYLKPKKFTEKKEIPIILELNNITKVRVGNTSLDFGVVNYGSAAQKTIELKNNYDFIISVFSNVSGNVSDFIVYEKEFYLSPGEKKDFVVSTIEFSDQPYGYYSGTMEIVFKRVKD